MYLFKLSLLFPGGVPDCASETETPVKVPEAFCHAIHPLSDGLLFFVPAVATVSFDSPDLVGGPVAHNQTSLCSHQPPQFFTKPDQPPPGTTKEPAKESRDHKGKQQVI